MVPSWVRRAWTGSTELPPVRPRAMSTMPSAASAAMARGRTGIGLDLDVDDATDEHEPDEHHDPAEDQDDDAGGQPGDAGRIEEPGIHEPGRGHEQEAGQADRQHADDVARQSLLSGEGPNLALDADTLADRVGD